MNSYYVKRTDFPIEHIDMGKTFVRYEKDGLGVTHPLVIWWRGLICLGF